MHKGQHAPPISLDMELKIEKEAVKNDIRHVVDSRKRNHYLVEMSDGSFKWMKLKRNNEFVKEYLRKLKNVEEYDAEKAEWFRPIFEDIDS